ncbi:Aste57867_4756 [Aphanomyces stellatus]|uniref:Aste57867_4756 protein n=1 Tax=Aphanomyces stellatus TaxID=120398 RepID=A0A485KDK3_9STRA|nr:hypothetical protein As57867_004743 [Aphanomyces stellatus]VFT81852.1 Aste57867_4756 [Aphanomyces stellatus]
MRTLASVAEAAAVHPVPPLPSTKKKVMRAANRAIAERRRRTLQAVQATFRKRMSSARLLAAVLDFRTDHIAEGQIRAVLAELKIPVLVVLVAINFFSGLYLLLWSILLFSMQEVTAVSTASRRRFSACVLFAMSLVHFHELVALCGYNRRTSMQHMSKPNLVHVVKLTKAHKRSILYTVLRLDVIHVVTARVWTWVTKTIALPAKLRRQLVRLLRQYEVVHILRHVLVTVTTSIHAHHMATVMPEPTTTFTYTFLVALNCLFTPVFFTSKNAFVKKYLTLLLDAVFHFILSVGFPFIVFWPTYIQYTQSPIGFLNTNYVGITQNLLIDKLQTFTTFFYFVIALTMHISNHLSVHYLAKMALTTKMASRRRTTTHFSTKLRRAEPWDAAASVEPKRRVAVSPLPPPPSTTTLVAVLPHPTTATKLPLATWIPVKSKSRVQTHHRSLFILASYSWAICLVAGASSAFLYTPCPAGCRHRISDWFNYACACRDYTLTCADAANTSLVPSLLQAIDPDLFLLHIRNCSLPQGLPHGLIERFQGLYLLHLEQTQLGVWDETSSVLPSNLQFVVVDGATFHEVPWIFQTLPTSCVEIDLSYTPVETLPLGWTNVPILSILHGHLTTVPTLSLNIQVLALVNHSIALLPDPAQYPPSLRVLDLRYNRITAVPATVFTNHVVDVDVSYNPIATVPMTLYDNIYNMSLRVAGTPFCARLVAAAPAIILGFAPTLSIPDRHMLLAQVCFSTCAPGCEPDFIVNNVCDPACLTPACEFDGGDCSD